MTIIYKQRRQNLVNDMSYFVNILYTGVEKLEIYDTSLNLIYLCAMCMYMA